jgi:hypothetical protein
MLERQPFRWFALLPLLLACDEVLTLPPSPVSSEPGQVLGRVLLGAEALPGARIDLPFLGLTTVADAEGRFRIARVPEGSHRCVVQAERESVVLVARRDAVVFAGKPTDVGEVVLEASGSVSGRIATGRATGNSGGLVFVAYSDRLAVTGDDGSFSLSGLGAGEVVLEARLPGHAAGRVTVRVPAGAAAENVVIALAPVPSPRRGVLSGKVVLADGENAAGTLVLLEGTGLAVTVDPRGAWRFDAVPEDVYTLAFVREGYARLRVRAVPVDADLPSVVPDVTIRRMDAADLDGDGIADPEDDDLDGDGFCQVATDTCPSDAFPRDPQEWGDADLDGLGDRADVDDDNDSLSDNEELSAGKDGWVTEPRRADTDGDGRADAEDAFPLDPAEADDFDKDGVGDLRDNCRYAPNPDQADPDGNGLGDACDDDRVNRAPEVTFSGPNAIEEGTALVLEIAATDADGDAISLVARELPAGARFTDAGGGHGTLQFTPDFTQAGSYLLRVAATDGRALTVATHALTVLNKESADLPPTLVVEGRRSWFEAELVALVVRAVDSESRPITLTLAGAPPAALFVDAGDGTGSFSWLTTFEDAATYPLEFTATNGTTDQVVRVELAVENVNRPPQLFAPARVQAFEGRPVAFLVAAADPDGETVALSIEGDSTGISISGSTVSYLPPPSAAGTEVSITISASDGAARATTPVLVSVLEAPNASPVITVTGPLSIDEGQTLVLTVAATDPDSADSPVISARGLPANARFTTTAPGEGTLTFTPDFSQAGPHPMTFLATDGRAVALLERVVSVVNVPLPPTIALSTGLDVSEGGRLVVAVRATDPDREPIVLSVRNAPATAIFTDLGNGSGTLAWAPGYSDAGRYPVEFIASAGTREALISGTIVCADVNRPPTLSLPERISATAGTALRIGVTVADPDGLTLLPTLVSAPVGAVYANGEIAWTPPVTAVGTSVALDVEVVDGPYTIRGRCTVQVTAIPNRAPTLAVPNALSADEGQALAVTLTASDADGDALAFGVSGLPQAARVRTVDAGQAVLEWTPGFADAGSYAVVFSVSDGQLTAFVERAITVRNVTQPPLLTVSGARATSEGQPLFLSLRAIDYDGRALTLGMRNAPAGAIFTDLGDGSGTFTWLTGYGDSGTVSLDFFARAGTDERVVATVLAIADVNRAPTLVAPSRVDAVVGAKASVALAASDPDGTPVTLSLPAAPSGASLADAELLYTPPAVAVGTEVPIVVRVSDGVTFIEVTIRFNVAAPPNRLPAIEVSGPSTVNEGSSLTNVFTATDPDGGALRLFTGVLPANATFTSDGGTGTLVFSPDFTQSGSYSIVVGATDGIGVTQVTRVLVVADVPGDTPPSLVVGGTASVDEGGAVDFNLFATDAEGHAITLSLLDKPPAAVFTDRGGGLGTFRWTTGYTDAGTYSLTFKATANGLSTSRTTTAVVRDVNRAPVFASLDTRTIALGATATVSLAATDPDLDPLTYSFSPARAGASLSSVVGPPTFSFTPVAEDVGATISFDLTVSDGRLAVTRTLAVSVTSAANQPPIWEAITEKLVDEGQSVTYDVRATDPNGTTPSLFATSLPTNASFVDLGGGTGRITFAPHYDMAKRTDALSRRDYSVVVEARDASTATAVSVKFTVRNVNRTPTILQQSDLTSGAGAKVEVNATAADADADDTLTYVFEVSPQTLPFTVTGNKVLLQPTDDQATGVYTITMRARDNLLAEAVDTFTFTVVSPHWFPLTTGAGPAMGRGVMLVDTVRNQLVAFDPWRAPEAVYFMPYGNVSNPRELKWSVKVLSGTAGQTLPPSNLQFRAVYDPTRGAILLVHFDASSLNRKIWKLTLAAGAESWNLYSSTHSFPPGTDANAEVFAIDGPTDRFITMTGINYPAFAWSVPTLASLGGFGTNVTAPAMAWAVSDDTLRLSYAPIGNCLTPTSLAKYVLGPTASRTVISAAATAPLYRLGSSAAIDAGRNRLLVYGGQSSGGCSALTGTTDAFSALDIASNAWSTPIANRPPPPARAGAQMAVIPGKNWVVVQGGCSNLSYDGTCSATNTTFSDTWVGDLTKF